VIHVWFSLPACRTREDHLLAAAVPPSWLSGAAQYDAFVYNTDDESSNAVDLRDYRASRNASGAAAGVFLALDACCSPIRAIPAGIIERADGEQRFCECAVWNLARTADGEVALRSRKTQGAFLQLGRDPPARRRLTRSFR